MRTDPHTFCTPRPIALLSVLLVLCNACTLFPTRDPQVVSVFQEDQFIVVKFKPTAEIYYQACRDEVVEVSKVRVDRPRVPLTLSETNFVTPIEGYFLDDTFVPPSGDEGCDVIECIRLEPTRRVPLTAYTLGKNRKPPADFLKGARKNQWTKGSAPSSVKSIFSSAIRGDVEVSVSYFHDEDCDGKMQSEHRRLTVNTKRP